MPPCRTLQKGNEFPTVVIVSYSQLVFEVLSIDMSGTFGTHRDPTTQYEEIVHRCVHSTKVRDLRWAARVSTLFPLLEMQIKISLNIP